MRHRNTGSHWRLALIAALSCLFIGAMVGACGEDAVDNDNAGPNHTDNGDDDSCEDVDCPEGAICEDGECVPDDPCADVDCPGANEECEDGECVEFDPCEDVSCPDGEICHAGECEPSGVDEGYGCAQPFDVTGLSDGDVVIERADPTGQPSHLETDCGAGEDSPEAVFHVRADEPAIVDITIIDQHEDANPKAIEIRQDSCSDGETTGAGCSDEMNEGDSKRLIAGEGMDYYVIVEADFHNTPGEFDIEFAVESAYCAPPATQEEGTYCGEADDELLACAVHEEQEYTCGTQCIDGECEGDHCANAIPVEGSATASGDLEMPAYDSYFDFRPFPDCSAVAGAGEGPTTDGQDVVFHLPGLVAGQDVDIRASGVPTPRIGIMDECDEVFSDCIEGFADHEANWTVPEDGDYWVVFNQASPQTDTQFEYSVEVLE